MQLMYEICMERSLISRFSFLLSHLHIPAQSLYMIASLSLPSFCCGLSISQYLHQFTYFSSYFASATLVITLITPKEPFVNVHFILGESKMEIYWRSWLPDQRTILDECNLETSRFQNSAWLHGWLNPSTIEDVLQWCILFFSHCPNCSSYILYECISSIYVNCGIVAVVSLVLLFSKNRLGVVAFIDIDGENVFCPLICTQ